MQVEIREIGPMDTCGLCSCPETEIRVEWMATLLEKAFSLLNYCLQHWHRSDARCEV